jgi:hypothetical protein
MIYRWREGARQRGSAQEVGSRLETIRLLNGGSLTPPAVVEDATAPESPLHPHFEWDDAKAADEFRLAQARELVASVMVVYADEVQGAPTEPVRAFASIGGETGKPRAYTSTLEAMRAPAMRAEILAQARAELEGWRRRYRHYTELAKAVEAIEQVLAGAA